MYLIVGLGNPGEKYLQTRHNVGFMVIDLLAEKLNINMKTLKHRALIGEGRFAGEKIILAKPQTYMNASGESVVDLVSYYKVPLDKVIVIVDDIDIDFGTIRIKKGGSSGSHNGMKSIIYQLREDQFPRLKISIGKKPEKMDLANFVLSRFQEDEWTILKKMLVHSRDAILNIIESNIEDTMNKYNNRMVE